MSNASRWRDTANLDRAVATAGGQPALDAAVTATLDDARGWGPGSAVDWPTRLAAGRDAQAARDDPGPGGGPNECFSCPGIPDRKRRRLYPGRLEPLHRRPWGHPQAHRRLRRRATQDRLNQRSRAPAPELAA